MPMTRRIRTSPPFSLETKCGSASMIGRPPTRNSPLCGNPGSLFSVPVWPPTLSNDQTANAAHNSPSMSNTSNLAWSLMHGRLLPRVTRPCPPATTHHPTASLVDTLLAAAVHRPHPPHLGRFHLAAAHQLFSILLVIHLAISLRRRPHIAADGRPGTPARDLAVLSWAGARTGA